MSIFGDDDTVFGEFVFGEAEVLDVPPLAGTITPDGQLILDEYLQQHAADTVPTVDWDFYTMLPNTNQRRQLLTLARARSVTMNLDQPHSIQFTLPGEHPEALKVDELITDILAVRNGQPIVRGRVGSSTDTVSDDRHDVSFGALSYKAILMRRELPSPINTLAVVEDQSNIAWRMIEMTQAQAGGNLGIQRGRGAITGVFRGDKWDMGKYIGNAIDDMSHRQYGFDWDIDTDLHFNVHFPVRGVYRAGFVASYPGNIRSFTRNMDTSSFANAVRAMGSTESEPPVPYSALVTVGDFTYRFEGRWDYVDGGGDVNSTAEVDSYARGLLAARSGITPTYEITFRRNLFRPDMFWLGDTVSLRIEKGRLNVYQPYRVQQIQFNIGDDNDEEVIVSLGAPIISTSNRLYAYSRRIQELERR